MKMGHRQTCFQSLSEMLFLCSHFDRTARRSRRQRAAAAVSTCSLECLEDRTAPAVLNVPGDFGSIQAAINAAQPWDVVHVNSGIYTETVQIQAKSNLKIEGAGIGQTIVDANDLESVFTITNSSGVEISQLTVRNGRNMGNEGGGVAINNSKALIHFTEVTSNLSRHTAGGISVVGVGSNVTLSSNWIHQNDADGRLISTPASGGFGGGIYAGQGAVVSIIGNTIEQNHAWNSGGAIYAGPFIQGATIFSSPSLVVIRENIILNNDADFDAGIVLSTTQPGSEVVNNVLENNTANQQASGIAVTGAGSVFIHNNTVVDTSSRFSESVGIRVTSTATVDIRNNVLVNNGHAAIRAPATSTENYNVASGQVVVTDGGIAAGASTVVVDPKFTNPAAHDYRLNPALSTVLHLGDPSPSFNNQDGTRNTPGYEGGPADDKLPDYVRERFLELITSSVKLWQDARSVNLQVGFPHASYGNGPYRELINGTWGESPDGDRHLLPRGFGSHVNPNEISLSFTALAAAFELGATNYAKSWGFILTGLNTLRSMQTSGDPLQFAHGAYHRFYETVENEEADRDLTRTEIRRDQNNVQAADDNALLYLNLLLLKGIATNSKLSIPDKSQVVALVDSILGAINLRQFVVGNRLIFEFVDGVPSLEGWDRAGAEGTLILAALVYSGQISQAEYTQIAATLPNHPTAWNTTEFGSLTVHTPSFFGAMYMSGLFGFHGAPVSATDWSTLQFDRDTLVPLTQIQLDYGESHNLQALASHVMTGSFNGKPLSQNINGLTEHLPGGEDTSALNSPPARASGPHAFYVPFQRWNAFNDYRHLDQILDAASSYAGEFYDPQFGFQSAIPFTLGDHTYATALRDGSGYLYTDLGDSFETLNNAYIILSLYDALNPDAPLTSKNPVRPVLGQVMANLFYQQPITQPIFNSPPTNILLSNATVTENAANGTSIGSLTATDPDPFESATFQLIDSAGGRFSLAGNTLRVANGSLIDFESTTSHTVIVQAADHAGLLFQKSINISVLNAADPPTISPVANQTAAEDAFVTVSLQVSDPDSPASAIVLSAVASDPTLLPANGIVFTGTTTSRTLTLTPAPNRFGSTTVTVTASDGVISSMQTFLLTVQPVADTPQVANGTAVEDSPSSPIVISRHALDGSEVTFFKVGHFVNGSLFQNDGTTPIPEGSFISFVQGQVGVVWKGTLNTNATGQFDVEASQDGIIVSPQSGKATSTITIVPVGDTPLVTSVTTLEDTLSATMTLSPNPVDGDGVKHFRISDIREGKLFRADGVTEITSGEMIAVDVALAGLRFLPHKDSNVNGHFAAEPSLDGHSISLQGPAGHATISVTPVADTPVVTDTTAQEDSFSSPITIRRNPKDGNEVRYFQITGITGGHLYQADRTTEILDQTFISLAEADGVVFKPTLNSLVPGQFMVAASETGVQVSSQSGMSTATILITPVDDPPVLAQVLNQETNEDLPTAPILVHLLDVDTATSALVVSAKSSNQMLVLDSQIQVTGSGSDRTLVINPQANQAGTVTISISVRDGTSETMGEFQLTIHPLPDPPLITNPQVIPVFENSLDALTVTASDPDDGSLTYSLAGGADAALFSIDSATGLLRYLVSPDFEHPTDSDLNNTYELLFRVEDPSGLTDSRTIVLQVLDKNEHTPEISATTLSVSENAAVGVVIGTLTATDGDSGQTFAWELLNSSVPGAVEIDSATGEIRVKDSALLDRDVISVIQIEVQVRDQASSEARLAQATIPIAIDGLNDHPPVMTLPDSTTVQELTTEVILLTATDADLPAQTIRIYLSGGADQGQFQISADGRLSFVSPPDFENPGDVDKNNSYQIRITADDGLGMSTTRDLAVLVTDRAEPPVITLATQPARYRLSAKTAMAIDPDGRFELADTPDGDFANAQLSVSISTNRSRRDTLRIADQAGVLRKGKRILVDGKQVGTIRGGKRSNSSLVITLNSSASIVSVQKLIQSTAFSTRRSSVGTRTISMQVTALNGQASNIATRQIEVEL